MLDAIMVIRGEVESYLSNQASRISITHQHHTSASSIKENGKVYKLFYLLSPPFTSLALLQNCAILPYC